MKKFGDWLNHKLIELDLKPAYLSRLSGLDSGVLSNIISGKRQNPSVETCKVIAKSVNIPIEEVHRAAGILEEKPNTDTVTETVVHLLHNLQESDREDVLEYARLRHKLATDRSKKLSQNLEEPMSEQKFKTEEFRVEGEKLIAKIKELFHEGNIRRVIIKDKEGKTGMEIPVTLGVVGVLLAPQLAAIGAIAALLTEATVVVEKAE